MDKKEIFELMNANPAFHIATLDGDQPRVRGMLLYRADENGIIFHTASSKDVYKQMTSHPKTELCFQAKGTQIRVTGEVTLIEDDALKEEIMNHPSRAFLQTWKELGIDHLLSVFCIKKATAVTWTMETNFDEKKVIQLLP